MTKNPQALILEALKSGPSYGLELVKRTGLSHGCVYNNLRLLEQGMQIAWYGSGMTQGERKRPGRPRTYYRLVKP